MKAYLKDITPYTQGKSKAGENDKVIKLSSNESSIGPSPQVFDALKIAYKKLHRYPDGSHQSLREAIGEVHGLESERIICGNGSDELIDMLIRAYAGVGDEVLYSEYGFLMYRIYAQASGATPVAAKEVNLTAHVDNLLAAVTPRTKILFLANPNNPTGSYLPASEVARLRKNLRDDIVLVVDAAYAEYPANSDYTDGRELVDTSLTVMLRTFSKAYGLPLLRLGWGYAPDAVLDALNRLRSPFNVNGLALAAGEVAVRDQVHLQEAVAHNNQCLADLPAAFAALGITVHPSVTNFLLLDFGTAARAKSANDFLLSKGVILREVGGYGLPQCLRMTIGLGVENAAVLALLGKWKKIAS
jgi:histidinol-phosphate aminotransferase